jgi:hypothetical protein
MAQGHATGKFGMAGQKRCKGRFITVQDHVKARVFGDTFRKTGNDSCRSTIATHGIH